MNDAIRAALLKTEAGQQIVVEAKWSAGQHDRYIELRDLTEETFLWNPPLGFRSRPDVACSSLANIRMLSESTPDDYNEAMAKVKHAYDSANAYSEAIALIAPAKVPEYSERVYNWVHTETGPLFIYNR
jgi:hypothetical protein